MRKKRHAKQQHKQKKLHITLPDTMKLMEETWVHDEESCQITKSLLDVVLVYYANSGYFRYKEINEYDMNQDGKDIDLEKVERELRDEVLSDAELMNMITDFYSQHNFEAQLYTCGASGN